MNKRMRTFSLIVLLVLVLGLGLTAGIFIDRQAFIPDPSVPSDATENFALMAEAWNDIQKAYVDRSAVDPQNLTYGAIGGMVDALGDTGHSTFLTPEMLKEEQNFTQGQFEGIGALVEMKDGHATIVAPIDGSPAQKAGLKPGDIISKVNGEDVTGLPLNEIVDKVLGPAGTKVTLTILDPQTNGKRDVTITRAHIELQNVTWRMLPGTTIAHVRIAGFSQGVTADLKSALQAAQQQGATGLVLDLRNDPGGLLDEAIGVASQFLSDGNVMLEKNAQGETKPLPVESGGVAQTIPMVVLINNGTASAAEIVAGALQDASRATIVGETTFGTGTVLNQFKLSDGSALMLATEEWLTPKGRTIWHLGISPDVTVTLQSDATPLIPEAEQGMSSEQINTSGDSQLLKAIEILDSHSYPTAQKPPTTAVPPVQRIPANISSQPGFSVKHPDLLAIRPDYNVWHPCEIGERCVLVW
jgi:carboxyl-terminal processing protease